MSVWPLIRIISQSLILTWVCWQVRAGPSVVFEHERRRIIQTAQFGFLSRGQLTLTIQDYKLDDSAVPGPIGFYIQKGDIYGETWEDRPDQGCILENNQVADEIADGISVLESLESVESRWQKTLIVEPTEEGVWNIMLVNCKDTGVSLKLDVSMINPGNNHLSAGDTPLYKVYGTVFIGYLVLSIYWLSLIVQKDTKVFRAHWLMLLLVMSMSFNKALQSAKYYYMKIGLLSNGWRIGFYVFAFIKGFLSILIIVLLASGWIFIKPFLSSKDKRVISILVPLQILANVAAAIQSEATIKYTEWTLWTAVLSLADILACGVVLWTILQTRKHLGVASSADGKELGILKKYELWSSLYIVGLVYVYITRIFVQLLQVSLPFRYVNWLGIAVGELATLLFFGFIGPSLNNPYMGLSDQHPIDWSMDEARGQNILMARRDTSGNLD
ncbi:lung seven transmembrane receptor-domain-containing protein [Phycomyces nitens]|nr:lung seven transmembrane receptor-domain-containing protein [Phycomyces nitens]